MRRNCFERLGSRSRFSTPNKSLNAKRCCAGPLSSSGQRSFARMTGQATLRVSQAPVWPRRSNSAPSCAEESVLGFETQGGTVTAVTSLGRYPADDVVVTAVLESSELVPLGYDLPICPVTGYSVTYKVRSGGRPRVGAVSIPPKIAWAAFDDTVRFTGFADIEASSKLRAELRFRAPQVFAEQVFPETRWPSPVRVGRSPPYDSRQLAVPRDQPAPQHVAQLRARCHGVDHSLRFRAGHADLFRAAGLPLILGRTGGTGIASSDDVPRPARQSWKP